MVNSVNTGGGPQVQPNAGGTEKRSVAETITKAVSLSQLRVAVGELRDIPVPDRSLGGKAADFMRALSLGPDALSSGEIRQEKTSVGARLRLEALDRTPLSRDDTAMLDEILGSIVGRRPR